ncbi:MAG: 1-acyl-sn-glycerol-3-phosphate acyltransferase [Blastocatellales bacterium]|nr:1-acyl-sn-glycerol-3-phosphate acyltransferase [Blastocatellales bacterium]
MSATSTTEENRAASSAATGRSVWADLFQRLIFALAIKPFMILFIGLRVSGRRHLPEKGPFILYANHSSHLDTVSLLSLFPTRRLRELRPVAAADYFERNRWVSLFSRTFFNTLPIARRDISQTNNPLKGMLSAIESGQALIIFPEGTRGSGESLGAFRSGLSHLVEQAPGIPVVPVALVNMGRSLPKGALIPVPFFCEIRVGEPRVPSGARSEIRRELEGALRNLLEGGR